MRLDEFNMQTQRLCNLYGKSLNDEQMEFWYESLKDYELEKYRRAVGEYAKKNKYMPTISDILGEIRNLKPYEKAPTEKVECKACNGSGYVLYRKDDYEYASLCNCKNAIGKDYYNKDTGYYIPKAADVFRIGGNK